jgi:hypothetical protein
MNAAVLISVQHIESRETACVFFLQQLAFTNKEEKKEK